MLITKVQNRILFRIPTRVPSAHSSPRNPTWNVPRATAPAPHHPTPTPPPKGFEFDEHTYDSGNTSSDNEDVINHQVTARLPGEQGGLEQLTATLRDGIPAHRPSNSVEYNAQDFAGVDAPPEIRQLFGSISQYRAKNLELPTRTMPFIPDYVPSLGEMDEFIKIPRPDGQHDFLGLIALDESALKQSNANLLMMELKALSRVSVADDADLGPAASAAHAAEVAAVTTSGSGTGISKAEVGKRIQEWVNSVETLHRRRPVADVSFLGNMPDMESLMAAWGTEEEHVVRSIRMPDGHLPVPLPDMVRIFCSILDIPVGDNPIESLHVLFTLFHELKTNPFVQGRENPTGLGEAQIM